ncbi:MAG: SPFH/Band 7/PHB domain protein [Lachnospiraceae bacterium]|nr:SPFH/Band 7/PHB domain protein [Lachnospiraceae bacterium]
MPIIALIVIVVLLVIFNIKIVREGYVYVIETLGKYSATWEPGLHVKIPFIQRIGQRVSMKEQVADFEPQRVITKDNVSITSDSVVYFKIFDAYSSVYKVQNYSVAIQNLTATTLRSIIGDMTLDQTLNSREEINQKMLVILDEATDPWGIKITRVEIKNITPDADMSEAMEAQARAERNKRAQILEAEGFKESAIRRAEGEKESAIKTAEGQKQATILAAEAEKEKRIQEAEGMAQAIEREGQAKAEAIRMIKDAGADEAVLTMKSLEALERAANGRSNTVIIPSEVQGIAGLATTLKTCLNADAAKKEEDKA